MKYKQKKTNNPNVSACTECNSIHISKWQYIFIETNNESFWVTNCLLDSPYLFPAYFSSGLGIIWILDPAFSESSVRKLWNF